VKKLLLIYIFLTGLISSHAQIGANGLPINMGPEKTVNNWLNALDKGDARSAYEMSKNINRNNYWDWDLFKQGFGCINNIEILNIKRLSSNGNRAQIKTEYKSYDPCNSNLHLMQQITVTRDYNLKWSITEIENILVKEL
jgi:hypothetical protein